MSRRQRRVQVVCVEDGCRESSNYIFDTAREEAQHFKSSPRSKYRCLRHSRPNNVLMPGGVITTVMKVYDETHGRYFTGEGGVAFGPGFQAYPKDFLPGDEIHIEYRHVRPKKDPSAKVTP